MGWQLIICICVVFSPSTPDYEQPNICSIDLCFGDLCFGKADELEDCDISIAIQGVCHCSDVVGIKRSKQHHL